MKYDLGRLGRHFQTRSVQSDIQLERTSIHPSHRSQFHPIVKASMIYLDENSDRICQWEDLQAEERILAAHSILETGKYITRVNGLWHKLEQQDRLGLKVWLIAEAKREMSDKFSTGNASNLYPLPRLTKIEKRRLKHAAWLEFWMPKILFIRGYVHQRDNYGYTRPRTCSEIAKWVGIPPYKVSRIAQKAIQLGFIAKKGRSYVPKIGRPPVL